MSTPAYTDYSAESRTFTSPAQPVTVQAWKKTREGAVQAIRAEILDEPRTAAPEIHPSHSFHEELTQSAPAGPRTFETALNMSEQAPAEATPAASSDFSFDDFIDIVNPLQHLPVVGMIYREITGDKIGPVAQIVGGGIFGGPVGAVSGTVNAIVQDTTGKDVAGNVLALVTGDDTDDAVTDVAAAPDSINRDNPEMVLSLADAHYNGGQFIPAAAHQPVPETAMGFTQMRQAAAAYERAAVADGRTAGWNARRIDAPVIDVDYSPAQISLDALPPREPVTVMPMKSLGFGGLY